MKKKLVLAALFMALTLSGCGDNAKVIEGEVQTLGNGSETQTDVEAGTDETAESAEGQNEEVVEYKGYAFLYQDAVIEMDADAAPIIEQLGEANFYFESPSCAFEGIDKLYTYSSFELDTYPTGDKDYVSAVVFKDDTITTAEGIGIGDSMTRLEEVYGTEWNDEDGMVVYEKDDMKLCFILEEDVIISVEYRSTAIEE